MHSIHCYLKVRVVPETFFVLVLVDSNELSCEFSGVDWLCGWSDVSEGANHWTLALTGYTGHQDGTYISRACYCCKIKPLNFNHAFVNERGKYI